MAGTNIDAKQKKNEISAMMNHVEVGVISTFAGEQLRSRMMHYAVDEELNVYLATMKGDPKTLQLTHHPSVAALIYDKSGNINEAKEIEITGKAFIIKNEQERGGALQMIATRSPVVKYMLESNNEDRLDCIKILPERIKYRVFGEIAQGLPPAVLEFPENRAKASDFLRLRKKIKSWLLALRVPFFTATAVPILLGTVMGWVENATFLWGYFLLTLLAGLFFHGGTNLINDYFDHKSGNDEFNREFIRPFTGGSRVIQLGLLTPLEILLGSLVFFFFGSLIGLYLAFTRGEMIFVLGIVGIVSGMFYSGKPFNWVSRGVGELIVGLNFGILMVLGAYYVQTQSFSWDAVMAGLPIGLYIASVLYINEFPDYQADKMVGKNTLVVRLGKKKAVFGYIALVAGVYLSLLVGVLSGLLAPVALIALTTLPFAIKGVQYARKNYAHSFDLVPANALTVIGHLSTGLLIILGYSWLGFKFQGLGYFIILVIVFVFFVLYMYRHIERQKDIFLGLKQAIK